MLRYKSLPSRGAWIEIGDAGIHAVYNISRSPHGERGLKFPDLGDIAHQVGGSLPSRGAWIEIALSIYGERRKQSLPSRGAWIEIVLQDYDRREQKVAPLTGSVD